MAANILWCLCCLSWLVATQSAPQVEAEQQGLSFTPHSQLQSSDIVFAVITGSPNHQSRAVGVRDTWCAAPAVRCVFFSDTVDASIPTLAPYNTSGSYDGAQLRYLPALQHMHSNYPDASWIGLVDDDTFVFVHNLLSLLSVFPTDSPSYVGQMWNRDFDKDVWKYPRRGGTTNIPFANGGAGAFLSRGAMRSLNLTDCVSKQQPGAAWAGWQSDWMVGACCEDAKVQRRDDDAHFHQELPEGGAAQWTLPATVHYVKSVDMMHAWRERHPNSEWEAVEVVQMGVDGFPA